MSRRPGGVVCRPRDSCNSAPSADAEECRAIRCSRTICPPTTLSPSCGRETTRYSGTSGEGRKADFHVPRTTYITALVKVGASVKVAQELARHSDPNLTINAYKQVGIDVLAEALDGLYGDPTSEPPQAEAMKATGPDDCRVDDASDDVSKRRSNGEAESRGGAGGDALGERFRLVCWGTML